MRKKRRVIAIIVLIFSIILSWLPKTSSSQTSTVSYKLPLIDSFKTNQNRWADSLLATMTLEEKIGQLFMIATYSNRTESYYQQVESQIINYKVGGLLFFQGGPYRQANLTNRYQSLSRVPMLIGLDAEWGLGMRLDSVISFPKQISLGAVQDNKLIEKVGQEMARQCRRIGVHINFAPDVDINNNPLNPVINYRSFGESKFNVAEKGAAIVRGMKKEHVMSCAKHFPGHGDTDADSHFSMPMLTHSEAHLRDIEMYPFQRLIADSVSSVMSGHLYVPSLDGIVNSAASVSERIIKKYLKQELGFDGLVITDALNMRGLTRYYTNGNAELAAFKAGNDILLQTENLPVAFNRLRQAFTSGELAVADLDERVRRILRAKYWAGLNNYHPIDLNFLASDLNDQWAEDLKSELYENAITVAANKKNILPFAQIDTTTFASITISADFNNDFQKSLSQYANFKHFTLPFKPSKDTDWQWVMQEAAKYKVVVVAVHDMNGVASRNFGVTYSTVNLINQLSEKTNVVVCAFGSPYGLKLFHKIPTVVCGYEDDPLAQKAMPQILFGALASKGKLPITASYEMKVGDGLNLPRLGRLSFGTPESVGMNSHRLNDIEQVVQQGINNRAFPGCQVVVARRGKIVYHKAFGTLRYDMNEPVTEETIYDLASLTKVTATLQAVMLLNERQEVDLNQKVSYYLPELVATNKENMVIADILQHEAGLLAFVPFWERTKTGNAFKGGFYAFGSQAPSDYLPVSNNLSVIPSIKDSLWQWVIDTPLNNRFDRNGGYRYLYSDLGLIMMQKVVERITKQPLDAFVEQNIYEPLGMSSTLFNPQRRFPKEIIAPTENDYTYRGEQIQGTVHDSNAALQGGVSGHAGLFSTALDLAKLFQMNMQKGSYGGRQILFPETVNTFSHNYTEKSHRGIGWDKPIFDDEKPVVAADASVNTFGHTGFTGTVAWADPDRQLIFIFLSNRVYPNVQNNRLNTLKIRKRIHEIINASIINW